MGMGDDDVDDVCEDCKRDVIYQCSTPASRLLYLDPKSRNAKTYSVD